MLSAALKQFDPHSLPLVRATNKIAPLTAASNRIALRVPCPKLVAPLFINARCARLSLRFLIRVEQRPRSEKSRVTLTLVIVDAALP